MSKRFEKRLMREIVQDLIKAGLVKRGVVVHKEPQEELHVFWSEAGTKGVAGYAEAMSALRTRSEKRIAVFQGFMLDQACRYLEEEKWLRGVQRRKRGCG